MTTSGDKNDPRYQNRSIRIVAAANPSAPAPDLNLLDEYQITALAQTCAFAAPTNSLGIADARLWRIRIVDNGTARTLSWASIYKSSTTNILPTTTVTGKTMRMGFCYDSVEVKHVLIAGPTYD